MPKNSREWAKQVAIDSGEVWTHVFRAPNGDILEVIAEDHKAAARVLKDEGISFPHYCGVKE